MEEADLSIHMEIYLKEIGKITKQMVMENILPQTA
jgi:hypothetical protein